MNWEFPYPSRRMPVFARNAVATSQPLAAQAGLRMLLCGGNAVDAALAAAIALTVIEPTSNGIGSDAFAIVWDGEKLHGLNGSGRSPRSWSENRFSGRCGMPQFGWDAVTVPGAVDLWSTLSTRFGALPFPDLFQPALEYARHGFVVPPITAEAWSTIPARYHEYPEFMATFAPNGRAPYAGERFRPPGLAQTLEWLAESHGESLYRGELAERIVSFSRETGGSFTARDLGEHHTEWVPLLSLDWNGISLHELPPNGQGLIVLIALGILKFLAIEQYPIDSPDSLHLQIEAMKKAFETGQRHIADPAWMTLNPADLLEEALLSEIAGAIRMDRAGRPAAVIPDDGGTVYLTAADERGAMVSLIQSNYRGFGSGIVVPETGISLQNRGSGFVLAEGHPNHAAGGKRPFHTIIPGFVMKDKSPLMSFGVMGAHMQAQGHIQMMIRIFAGRQNPQTALDAPRWYITEDAHIALEAGIGVEVRDELMKRGHILADPLPTPVFGGGQIIHRLPDGYCAASDPRKDGQAVGF
jgi:gamma-glutamyltranspeptidase / glutathione hydrolase